MIRRLWPQGGRGAAPSLELSIVMAMAPFQAMEGRDRTVIEKRFVCCVTITDGAGDGDHYGSVVTRPSGSAASSSTIGSMPRWGPNGGN